MSSRGRIIWRQVPSGNYYIRLDFGRIGSPPRRVFLDSLPTFDGGRRPLRCAAHLPDDPGRRPPILAAPCPDCEKTAEKELQRIHAMLVTGDSLETVLARIRSRTTPEELIETWLKRYLEHFRGLVEADKRSPTTLRELERYAEPDGHFGWWWGRSILTMTSGQVQDWHAWLAKRPRGGKAGRLISLKTQKNVSDAFRGFLGWLRFREEIARVPEFPPIEAPEYLPQTLPLDLRARVLAEIPWERRGAFLAASWLLMRPREARAVDLDDYDPERNCLAVYKACKGPGLDAPIKHTKARAASWTEVWDDELRQWILWRLEQATPERRMAGEVALFWCPTATEKNLAKRWTDDPLRKEWSRACKRVGVKIPLYQGTKHSTATALAEGGVQPLVLKALGRWKDSKSVEKYAKPKATRAAIIRHLPGADGTTLEPRPNDAKKR